MKPTNKSREFTVSATSMAQSWHSRYADLG